MKLKPVRLLLAFLLLVGLFGQLSLSANAYVTSDWVLASSAPQNAQIVARKWTYQKTTYVNSRETSMPGYTLASSSWVADGSGSANYASFPNSGNTVFDTSHWIYTSFYKSNPYSASESQTAKRTVSTSWAGYVYWHWMYNVAYANRTDRTISGKKLNKGPYDNWAYVYFYAFLSSVDCPYLSNGYCCNQNLPSYNCHSVLPETSSIGIGTPRFLRFDYYVSSYQDYYKLFRYYKTENLESDTAVQESSSGDVVISNVVEYVKYKSAFEISYNANGGTDAPSPQFKPFGQAIQLSNQIPKRTGYTFLGWSTSSSATSAQYCAGGTFNTDADTTLYAVWKRLPEYTVTYNATTNGGSAVTPSQRQYYEGQKADLSVAATKSGWSFVGWNTNQNAHTALSDLTVTSDTTLYAIFSKTVKLSFYIEDNRLHTTLNGTYYNMENGAAITLPALPAMSGWKTEGWSLGENTYQPGGTVQNIKSDVRLNAKYSKSLTLSYNANGGTAAPNPVTTTLYRFANSTYTGGQIQLAAAINRSGHRFEKWALNSPTGTLYAAGATISIRENTVMYATWTELSKYTVTYDAAMNGGTVETSQRIYYEGQEADLSVTAVRSGWSFVGWNTDPNAHTALSKLTVGSNDTVYAIFSKTVKLSFYIEDNKLHTTLNGTYYNRENGAAVTLPALPAMSGWKAEGWSLGGNLYQAGGLVQNITSDVRVNAKYSKSVTLSYDANGGLETPPSVTVTVYRFADGKREGAQLYLAAAIARSGHQFEKWALNSPTGTLYGAGDPIFITEDTVMYATWTPVLAAPEIKVSNAAVGKTVQITAPEGATVHYTTDGSVPTHSSARYSGAVTLRQAGSYSIKAVAFRDGWVDSPEASKTVTVTRAPKPRADKESGYLPAGTEITLSIDTSDGTVHFTTDGSTPTADSPAYTGPIVVEMSLKLRAVTAAPGCALSEETVYDYSLTPPYTPDPWGWGFVNTASSFGYQDTSANFLNYCIPYSSVSLIFGDNQGAKEIYKNLVSSPWGGNCCGMASTSALLWSVEYDLEPQDFGGAAVKELDVDDTAEKLGSITVRTFIEALQVAQCSVQFDQEYTRNKVTNAKLAAGKTLDALVGQVGADLLLSRNDMIVVGMRGVGEHALLAYDIKEDSAGIRLYVYDCNHPCDDSRVINLTRNAAGAIVGWSYDMSSYGVWGSDEAGSCTISYVPYSTLMDIWENRGDLAEDYTALTVSTGNASLYMLTGEYVGAFDNGLFVTERDDVYEMPNLSLTAKTNYTIYVPEDYYVVTNESGGAFEASMAGKTLSASVSTDATAICFAMNQAHNINNIGIQNNGAAISYSVSLGSSVYSIGNNLVFNSYTINGIGTGTGEGIVLNAGSNGLYQSANTIISSYIANGEEQIMYTISASAGSGGSISTPGDSKTPAHTDVTYTFTPAPGYRVREVIVDGNSIGRVESYTFYSIGKDHSIYVSFESAYSIESVRVFGDAVSVLLHSEDGARLALAVYDSSDRLVEICLRTPSDGQSTIDIRPKNGLPAGGRVKAFIVDSDSRPLCKALSSEL